MRDPGVDLDRAPLPRTLAALEAGQQRGLHDAARVHLRLRADRTLSASVGTTGAARPVDGATVFPWTCATKPIVAIGLGRLADQGALALDDDLRRWLPEAPAAWGPIRLTHLLTHTVGWVGDPGLVAAITGWDDAVERVLDGAQVEPDWAPGERAAYSVWTGWLLLGEVLRRVAGEDAASWLAREVLAPAGLMGTTLVVTAEAFAAQRDRCALLEHRGPERVPYVLDGADHAHRCWPGLSARGPTADLSRLVEVLLLDGRGEGPGILRPETATRLVTVAREGLVDEANGTDHAWGLGLTVDRRAFHPKASPGTFGHAGIGGSALAFADPGLGLAAALTTDGIPSGLAATARRFGIVQAIYADVAELRVAAS